MSKNNISSVITLYINGCERRVDPKTHSSLLAYLRNELRLTGTKEGCATGNCGACSVLVNNVAAQSCQLSLAAAAGSKVNTIEQIVKLPLGAAIGDTLVRYDAAQCGYCLPGIVVAAYAELLNAENPNAVDALKRNLCRCGTHTRILSALREVISAQESSS